MLYVIFVFVSSKFYIFLACGVRANITDSLFFSLTRSLLKQLVTMEVIQWTALWNTFKDEFENENNMLGGSLGDKAAEDLRLRVIEHVLLLKCKISLNQLFIFTDCTDDNIILLLYYVHAMHCLTDYFLAEYHCCLQILLKDNIEETCRSIMPHFPGWFTFHLPYKLCRKFIIQLFIMPSDFLLDIGKVYLA